VVRKIKTAVGAKKTQKNMMKSYSDYINAGYSDEYARSRIEFNNSGAAEMTSYTCDMLNTTENSILLYEHTLDNLDEFSDEALDAKYNEFVGSNQMELPSAPTNEI